MQKFYSKKEYQEISNLFNLGKINTIKIIRQGLWTPKVKVFTPKGGFIVSKYKLTNKKDIVSKSQNSLQYEIDLMNHFKKSPTLKYIKSRNKNFIEEFGEGWVTVDKLIIGKNPKIITPKIAYQLGEFLSKFHLAGRSFTKKLSSRREFYNFTPQNIKVMTRIALENKNLLLKKIVQEIKKGVLKNKPPKNLPQGPIHVDLKPSNELFIKEKLTGIVDFGNFYIGPFMVDIGKTIMWNCCKKNKLDPKLVLEIMRGYKNRRKLNKLELNYFKKSILFAIYSHIWVDLYHVPIKYIPEEYTLSLVRDFLPVARQLEKENLFSTQNF